MNAAEIAEGALLLTASVAVPPGVPGVSQPDPRAREREYITSVEYFLRRDPLVRRLVFAEVSGWPLDRIAAAAEQANRHGVQIELLPLDGNDFPGTFGKGYGEAQLIDRALDRSAILSRARWVAKMTGRQRITNLTRMLSRLPARVAFAGDIHDHGLYERFRLPAAGRYCDTRFFVFAPDFFDRHLRRLHQGHKAGEFNLEGAYYAALKGMPAQPGVLTRLPAEPMYRGMAGHWHKSYDSPRARAKQLGRAVLRRLLPNLHV